MKPFVSCEATGHTRSRSRILKVIRENELSELHIKNAETVNTLLRKVIYCTNLQ